MLNLAIEIAHDPADEWVLRLDVDSVVDSVTWPALVYILFDNIQVCVRERKVTEEIHTRYPHAGPVTHGVAGGNILPSCGPHEAECAYDVAHDHPESFVPFTTIYYSPRMKV